MISDKHCTNVQSYLALREKKSMYMKSNFYTKRLVIDVTERVHKKVRAYAHQNDMTIREYILLSLYDMMSRDDESLNKKDNHV